MNAWLFKYLVDVIVMGSKCSKNVAAHPPFHIQHPTGLVDTVLVETTVLVVEKILTTQFYLLKVESPI